MKISFVIMETTIKVNYLNNLPAGVLLSLSILITIFGDFFAKYWSNSPNRTYIYWIAMVCWMIANMFFLPTLLKNSLILNGLIFTLGNIMGFTFVGRVVFSEMLTFNQTVGLALGFVALVLLNLK